MNNPIFKIKYNDEWTGESSWEELEVFLRGSIGDEYDYIKIGENSRVKNDHKTNKILITKSGKVKTKIEYYYDNLFDREWITLDEAYLCYEDSNLNEKRLSNQLGKNIRIDV